MQFLSKSALFHNQIEDRVEVIPELEIQLLSTKLNEFTTTHRQDLAQGLYKIKAIHMPFDNGFDTELQKESSVEVLEGVLDIAQEIAEIEHEQIIVVAHYSGDIGSSNTDYIVDRVRNALDAHKDVVLAVENSSTIEYKNKDGYIRLLKPRFAAFIEENDFKFGNIQFARLVNHERCKICLDTCHLIMTQKLYETMDKHLENALPKIDILKEAFRQAGDDLALVHLANAKGHGYGAKHHGTAFTEDDRELLKGILSMKIQCPITIEVNEPDVNYAERLRTTKATIDSILEEERR